MTSFRVLLVDDHPSTLSGLQRLLAPQTDIEVVGEATDAASALTLTERTRPHVVVLDIGLPDRPGTEIIGALRRAGARVLVFTAHAGRGLVNALLCSGAEGVVTKDQPEAQFVEALRGVAAGQGRWLVRPVVPESAADALAPRERDVLTLLARGLSNEHIGEMLCIKPKTVRNTLAGLYQKLGVADGRQALVWAREQGFEWAGTDGPRLRDRRP